MVKLVAKSPAEGLVPVETGETRLTENIYEAITWVAPLDGKEKAVAKALGLPWPKPGEITGEDEHLAIWTAPGQALILGPPVAPRGAAVADQSGGWCVLVLEGADAREVLARLTPLDLRDSAFPEAHTARTLIGHMTASLTRIAPDTYEIMVFRSMAKTAVHELTRAMDAAAARARL